MRRLALLGAAAMLAYSAAVGAATEQPAQILIHYLKALYARDFGRAYELISPRDKAVKPRSVYLQENRSLEGEALDFSRLLASLAVIGSVKTNVAGDRATVSFRVALPNANAKQVRALAENFDAAALERLGSAERERRKREIARQAASRELPTIESPDEEWHLVRVGGRWWLDLDWAGAVLVRFDAATMAGLAWEFEPLRKEVRAQPGETLQVMYRVRNPTGRTATAKARHVVTPVRDRGHLDIVTCFCFLEQTLRPGQQVELPVVFRVSYDVPENVGPIEVRYEFYPRDAFPKDAAS